MVKENRALQQAILDSANYTIISTEVDGIITTFNATAERWLGYKATEVVGKTTPILIHDPEEVKQRAQELSQELGVEIEPGFEVFVAKARRGEPDEREWSYIRKDSSRFPVLLSVTALRDAEGKITGFLGIGSDISKRKQAEAELERFFALSLDLLCIAGTDGYFRRLNPAFTEILGYTEAELLAQPFINFVHPEDREATLAEVNKLATGIPTLNFENRYRCKNGYYKWLAWRTFPVVEEKLLYAVARDITEQKHTRTERLQLIEQEKAARNQITSILESITDGFFALDNEWCFTYINRQAELLLQRQREELQGKNFWDEFPEAVGSTFYREYHRAVAQQVSVEFEEFYPPLDTWFAVHAYPSSNGLSVYFQDITERKTTETERLKNEERLRKQQAALIELAKNKVFYRSNLNAAVGAIVEQAAQTLAVERVGVWFYPDDRSSIYLVDQYELKRQQHSAGIELLAKDYPTYFQALETEEIVAADDAKSDPRTQEFLETWLVPNNIAAMMDVPIRAGDKTVGVICHEHVGSPRNWTIEEQNFASSLAYIISLAIEARDRAAAEEKLRESEERFHAAFDYAAIGMALVSLEGRWLQVNHSICEMVGYSEQELLATTFQAITHPDDLETDLGYVHQMLTGEIRYYHLEKRYIHKQGQIVWILLSVSLVRDTEDRPLYFVAQIQDITERKRVEEVLKESELKLRTIIENSVDAIMLKDREGRYLLINPAGANFLARPIPEILGKRDDELFTPATGRQIMAADRRVMAGGVPQTYEESGESGGVKRTYLSTKIPYVSPQGEILGIIGICRDITDRKQAEEILRESEERFRQLAENIREVFWIRDAQKNQMIYISPTYESVWGHSRSQLYVLYQSFLDTIHPEDRDRFRAALARQNQDGYDEEYRIVRPDGSMRWIHDRAFPIQNEAGHVYRIVGIAEDITERKEAETELVRQNLRSQLFAELTLKICQSLRLEEILQTAVAEVQKFLQADRVLLFQLDANGAGTVIQEEVVPGYPVTLGQDIVDPCFQEGYLEQYRQGRVGAIADIEQADIQPCHVEFLQQFEVKANLVVPILQQDRLWGLLIAHQCASSRAWTSFEIDLLQRLADQIGIALAQGQLVEALRESEARFRTVADSAPVLLWMAGTDKLYTFFNQSWLKFTGRTLEQEMGNGWTKGVHPEDLQSCLEVYKTAFDARESFQMEYRLKRADGEYRWILETGKPRFTPEGYFAGYIGSCIDLSDRRELEKLKDEFVSVVSHELRTPLTSIQGALDLLAGGALVDRPQYTQHMLKIAAKNADRLVRLINDILDIERIESGKVIMTKQVCDATHLITTAADTMENMAQQAQVTLSVSPLSARLWADPDRIIQVLTNLLSNGIKFSEPGSTVWLSAELELQVQGSPGAGESRCIIFQVSDRGRGIPADKIESIFGRFQQVDASDSRKKGGTGLGLAICRSIVQHHDGRIWAESTLGEGSTFYFTLPILQEEQETKIEANASGPLILVCDDDASVRTVVRTMLENQDYRAITVASGTEAVAQAAQAQPDVILLNLMMPGMNGWDTLAILKEQEETKNIPAIILSGLFPDARESHPGVSDWIVKPPDQRLLFQALERALAPQNQAIRVLIIEDDPDLAQVLMAMFERHGIQTYHAQTGREAIQLSQKIIPNLLVLDLILPEYDGFAVVDWLRQHNRLCHVPLVVYTAQDINSSDKDRLKLGQTLFFTKGRITPEEFEQRVVQLLNRIIRGMGEES